MQLVFCGTGWLPIVDFIRARLPPGATLRARDFSKPLAEDLADAQVILPSNARIDAAVIRAAKDLRLIQQPAVGYEGIDLDAARARGVPVCNAPGANVAAVAEAALFLILALARKLRLAERAFDAARIGDPLGIELRGKALGLVGIGGSGSRLGEIARAIGMRVLAVRSTNTRAELLAMLRESDVVSVHCPLDTRTRGMFDAEAFAAMKPGALLVNCARGPIIDRPALEHALASGRLGGLGLDTYWAEPWDPQDPLYRRDDVVTLPHVAGSTDHAFAGIADIVAENVRRRIADQPLIHRLV